MLRKKGFAIFLLVFFVLSAFAEEEKGAPDKTKTPTPFEALVSYVDSARFEDFPPEVIKRAKYLILDNIGCALGGTQMEEGRKFLRVGANWKGTPESTVIGTGDRISCMSAAYVNTELANILDFDDTYDLYSPGHPGDALIQPALVVGEAVGASGKELLTAIILAYEVSLRIGRGEGALDWQSTSYVGSITRGTITAAARLLKLNRDELTIAFRHVTEFLLPRKREKFDVPTDIAVPEIKSNFGFFAMEALLATRLAREGVTGFPSLLERDFKSWFLAGGEADEYDALTLGLGNMYRLMEVSFKPTPSCRLSHPAVTALWQALEGKTVNAKDIEHIVFKGVKRLDRPQWKIPMEAQFSLQCVLAMAAAGIEPGPRWYASGNFNAPEIEELAAKVKLENDPAAEELEIREGKVTCTVTVTFKNGTIKKATIDRILGAPDNPMSEEALQAKFRANCRDILSDDQANAIIEQVLNLEKLPNVSDLMKLLVSPKVKLELNK